MSLVSIARSKSRVIVPTEMPNDKTDWCMTRISLTLVIVYLLANLLTCRLCKSSSSSRGSRASRSITSNSDPEMGGSDPEMGGYDPEPRCHLSGMLPHRFEGVGYSLTYALPQVDIDFEDVERLEIPPPALPPPPPPPRVRPMTSSRLQKLRSLWFASKKAASQDGTAYFISNETPQNRTDPDGISPGAFMQNSIEMAVPSQCTVDIIGGGGPRKAADGPVHDHCVDVYEDVV